MAQKQYVHASCPRCGGDLVYEGGKKALKCRKCQYKRELGKDTDQVDNHPLTAGINWRKFERGMGRTLYSFACKSCKAVVAHDHEEAPEECPFCHSSDWGESKGHEKVMEPMQMIPFLVSKTSAIGKLKRWINPKAYFPYINIKWWYPRGIQSILKPENVKGIYVPVFYADIWTRTTWVGEAGFDSVKQDKDKIVKKRVFEKVKGYYENFWDAQEQVDSKGIEKHLMDIKPFNLRQTIYFNADHLKDWPVEVYQSKELDILKKIDKRLNKRLESTAKRRSRGQGMKDLKMKSEKFLIAFRHILVPVWIATYYYRGHKYQFLVNGESGKTAGIKPLSFQRIAMTIGGTALLMLLIAWLIS